MIHNAPEVSEVVAKILADESIEQCSSLNLADLSDSERRALVEQLRSVQSPVLSCDVACGPG